MGTCLSLKRGAQPDQPRAEVTVRNSCDNLPELAFKSRHRRLLCAAGHMIKLTEEREITPYTRVSPTTATAAKGILLASNWSRRPRNVSMAVWAGSRCSAIAVGPAPAFRSMQYVDRGTRRSGNLNLR